MWLALLRKGSQCFIGPMFDPPTCVTIIVKENQCDSE